MQWGTVYEINLKSNSWFVKLEEKQNTYCINVAKVSDIF